MGCSLKHPCSCNISPLVSLGHCLGTKGTLESFFPQASLCRFPQKKHKKIQVTLQILKKSAAKSIIFAHNLRNPVWTVLRSGPVKRNWLNDRPLCRALESKTTQIWDIIFWWYTAKQGKYQHCSPSSNYGALLPGYFIYELKAINLHFGLLPEGS